MQVGRDLVKEVTCAEPYDWNVGGWELGTGYRRPSKEEMRDAPLIVALDYGIKRNILHRLVASGFRVRVMPAAATAAEILARTHGNLWFLLFYGTFVVAVAIHAPFGLRNVLREWTAWRGRSLDVALALFSLLLLALGLRAVFAVYVS